MTNEFDLALYVRKRVYEQRPTSEGLTLAEDVFLLVHEGLEQKRLHEERAAADTQKVVRLHDGQPQQEPGVPSQGLIGALTQTLELAQSGRLQALWGTGFTSDGLRFVVKGGRHEDVYQMAGAIAFLGDEYRDEVLTKNRKD